MRRLILLLSLCLLSSPGYADEVKIFASNYPLAYFAEKISGKPEIVLFPEIDGDPAFWEPSAEQVAAIQAADVILLNGATYEKWRTHVSLPRRKVVDTSKGFKDQYIVMEHAVDHSHGPGGDHSHAGTAFTTWLDLSQAFQQAEAVKNVLLKAEAAPESVLNANFEALKKELLVIDKELKSVTEGQSEVPLVASHPVYQYFARRYDLNLKAVLWEPDTYPDEGMWRDLEALLKEHPAKWMIWEGDPLPESVAKLKEMGIESIVFDPCGNAPEQGDFLSVMKKNLKNLKKVFK